MRRFVRELENRWKQRPFFWETSGIVGEPRLRLPHSGRVLCLAPHPDDPESAAITCRRFTDAGCELAIVIVTTSPSGVEDEYSQKHELSGWLDPYAVKSQIRRAEQRKAAKVMGVGPNLLKFLEFNDRNNLEAPENEKRLGEILFTIDPDIVILPIGHDTNRAHAWVYRAFRRQAKTLCFKKNKSLIAFYNEDPKTIEIRDDLYVFFDEDEANKKRGLLRIHDSQQQRNLRNRSQGFDERILEVNRKGFQRFKKNHGSNLSEDRYAEVFELELFNHQMSYFAT